MKFINFITYFQTVVLENVLTNFSELPSSAPYGIWVTPSGGFIIINQIGDHDRVFSRLYPDIAQGKFGGQLQDLATARGFVRMAKMGPGVYGAVYSFKNKSSSAIKTAKDIATFYNMRLEDDFEGL
jgi:hypothetical protein